MGLAIPKTMADVTPEWLNGALHECGVLRSANVTTAEKETIGVGIGILGDLARVTLTYEREEAGAPKTLVAKLPTQDPGGRGVAQMLGFYDKEARIYHELAPRLAAPKNYYSARDNEAQEYVILMEDVSSLRQGDQVAGASEEDTELLLHEVGKMHAHWWESAELDALDWIPTPDAPMLKLAQTSAMMSLENFFKLFGERLDDRQKAIVSGMVPRAMSMQESFSDKPQTLNHGDLRLDNIFFGSTDGTQAVTLIDWQIAVRARGPYDIAYFLSQSVPSDVRKANEERWLKEYHAAVTEGRDGSYTWEQCWEDYRAATLFCVIYPVVAGGSIDLGNERGAELVGQMALRSVTAVAELDADELLPNFEEREPIIPS